VAKVAMHMHIVCMQAALSCEGHLHVVLNTFMLGTSGRLGFLERGV
jgi:hypothetical protein